MKLRASARASLSTQFRFWLELVVHHSLLRALDVKTLCLLGLPHAVGPKLKQDNVPKHASKGTFQNGSTLTKKKGIRLKGLYMDNFYREGNGHPKQGTPRI